MNNKQRNSSNGKVQFNETMNEFATESLSKAETKELGKKAKQALDSFEKSNF
ncbi:MAG: hypothetical protein ACI35O_04140 [Bacillaceae bacterium]